MVSEEFKWSVLEKDSMDIVFKQGGLLLNLRNECELYNLSATILVLFCSEGNNIPESMGMSQLFMQLLRNDSTEPIKWKFPPSWLNMEEGSLKAQDIY